MKKLLLGLLLISSLVQAEILATAPNRADGLMYFTDTHCSGKGAYWKIIYSTFNGGSTTFGCWIYDSGMIHILWSDTQSTIVIPASDLTLVNKGKDI